MRVNIFGVGRSGTKAIQLYIAYLIAKREEQVWINYEPYYWLDRKASVPNYEGIYHHKSSRMFEKSVQGLTIPHRRFLTKLHTFEGSTVTKFIRANGRIGAINQVMVPDFTLVVVRDLNQVLDSVAKCGWDLLGNHLAGGSDWQRLLEEVNQAGLISPSELNGLLKKVVTVQDQNAFYWFMMNLAALQERAPNLFYIDYERIGMMEEIVGWMGFTQPEYSIGHANFNGQSMNDNNLLCDDWELLNQLPGTVPEVGSLNRINRQLFWEQGPSSERKIKRTLSPFYDELNDRIQRRLNQRIKEQSERMTQPHPRIFYCYQTNLGREAGAMGLKQKIVRDFLDEHPAAEFHKRISSSLLNWLDQYQAGDCLLVGEPENVAWVGKLLESLNPRLGSDFRIKQQAGSLEESTAAYVAQFDWILLCSKLQGRWIEQLLDWSVEPEKLVFCNEDYSLWGRKAFNSYQNSIREAFLGRYRGNIVIFGAGSGGRKVLKLIHSYMNQPHSFAVNALQFYDNDPQKWGQSIFGLEVVQPAYESFQEVDFIYIASTWRQEAHNQLIGLGWPAEKLVDAFPLIE